VKDAPGGLRDLGLIDWLARLHTEIEAPGDRLAEAGALLAAVRCFLHYHAGKDSNVLDFEAQEALAGRPFAGMRRYFRNAREIWNETRRALDLSERNHGSILENLRERARPATAEFTVSRERVLLRNPSHLENDPDLVFGLLEFIARHGEPPAPETERRLEAAGPAFAALCARPGPVWPKLKSILACPHASVALRALENTGLLPALFPEWASIEDLPLHQPDHRYTADEHTLAAIERVADLRAATDPARRRFADLLSEIDDATVLLFALLFQRLGPADAAMARFEMPPAERDAAAFLLERQRDLADAMSGRDLDDPATARLLAERTGTVERLKLLTVFTYAADPGEMSPWRLEQLWRVFSVTQHELTRELETDRIGQAPAGISGPAEFLQGFPTRYLRARPQAEIEAHLRLYELSRPTGAAVQLDQTEGAYKLTIVARDRPYLFASFAGAITSFGLDILKAEAFANSRGVILDTFVFADPKRMLQLNPSEVERLRDLIQRVALGKTDARRLMRNPPQPDPRKRTASPQVQFDSEACETATLVEIVTEDRPGLLYSLATVFSSNACNIDVVLIDTKGRRAIDVFYVAHEGRKLPSEVQERLREKLLAAC
jgi:[protein-PII] uridylyltransferase